jgi:methyltransferase
MDLSTIAFLALLVTVALLRFVELHISKRHQEEMIARGAAKVDKPKFRWMVLLHTAVLAGAAVEVLLRRPFIPWLAAPMFTVFLAVNAVRWDLSGNAGGLNGSTQHSARTRLALKTKAKIAR